MRAGAGDGTSARPQGDGDLGELGSGVEVEASPVPSRAQGPWELGWWTGSSGPPWGEQRGQESPGGLAAQKAVQQPSCCHQLVRAVPS